MIKSMTGYGSAKAALSRAWGITVELKSVNNRYLDASVRMPRSFLFAEDAVKSVVQKHISRGKVDVFVSVDSSAAGDMSVKVNEPAARLCRGDKAHCRGVFASDDVTALSVSRFPDVSRSRRTIDAEAISQGIVEIAELALQDFDAMRLREAGRLRDDDVTTRLDRCVVTKIEKGQDRRKSTARPSKRGWPRCLATAGIEESRILPKPRFSHHVAIDKETVRLPAT